MRINALDSITFSTAADYSSRLYCLMKAHDQVSQKTLERIQKPQVRLQFCKGFLQRKAQLSSISRDIGLSDLRPHFNKPIVQVARELGICTTFLKRICRRCGIKRWPHRQIRSLLRTIDMLKKAQDNTQAVEEKMKYSGQIEQLEIKLKDIINDPDANGKLERVNKSLFHKSMLPRKTLLANQSTNESQPEKNMEAAASLMLSVLGRSFPNDKSDYAFFSDESNYKHDGCNSGLGPLQKERIDLLTRALSL
uniref:Uncharacterized protein AlNc14C21G2215 n=1 Tax=Albugo laibachii Nc14 TaxID=890382 RepID=F0W5Q0_9STRA|nr:conserved hypothetical protein [Albugo laibachii Nc14]|eukprot:CCA16441.1 conserved hypothetical protein [Albugo laibachii Nc14]